MLRNFITLLFLVCLVSFNVSAYEVVAAVTDTVGEPVPYATYRIFSDSDKPLVSGTTDADGLIKQRIEKPGKYQLTVSYVGMRDSKKDFDVSDATPSAQLGNIAMHDSATQLEGVTVSAQRPLIVKEIDRIGYDVQADPATPTSSVSDILRKVPMVSVEADGTIRVNGSSDFKIYKNGRPNNSLSRNAKDLFAAMPASMIKKIEVITDPGASYDAEGTSAILNIVTNDNTSIKGVLGNARVRYSTMNKYPDANLWITSEVDKVTFSAYAGYSHLDGKMTSSEQWSTTNYPDGSYRKNYSSNKSNGDITFFGVNGSWQIDTLNLFTAEVGGYWYNVAPKGTGYYNTFDANNLQTGALSYSVANPHNRYFDIDANFNFQHLTKRPGEIYTISYMLSHTDQDNKNHTDYYDGWGTDDVPYSAISSDYNLKFIEHTVQADWTRTFGRHNIDFGAKGIFRHNTSNNNTIYEGWQNDDVKFRHITDIGALYGQYSIRFGPVNLRAGLRWEYSHLKASYPEGEIAPYSSNLSDWVPSAAASWQVNSANSLTFNYATSINRPGISYLNPAVTVSPTTQSYGNPDLASARRQSMKLTYMYIQPKFNFNFSVQYAFTNNAIAPVNFLGNDNIIMSTFDNVGHRRDLGFTGFFQWSVGPKTRILFNGGIEYQHASQNGMRLGKWATQGYAQITQQLPWKLSVELFGFYHGTRLNDVYGYSTNSFMSGLHYNLSLRRSFLKQDRLSVSLSAMSPIGPHPQFRTYTVNGDYTSESVTRNNFVHAFTIEINYRFGSLMSQVKKTQRSIDNDDLIGRKKE